MARKKREWVVLTRLSDPATEPKYTWHVAHKPFANATTAERWIRKYGDNLKLYQIACFIGGEVTVTIERVEKRSVHRKGDVGGKEGTRKEGD